MGLDFPKASRLTAQMCSPRSGLCWPARGACQPRGACMLARQAGGSLLRPALGQPQTRLLLPQASRQSLPAPRAPLSCIDPAGHLPSFSAGRTSPPVHLPEAKGWEPLGDDTGVSFSGLTQLSGAPGRGEPRERGNPRWRGGSWVRRNRYTGQEARAGSTLDVPAPL